ncbi:isotrichodermin C-15 hydroxylase [Diaporthe sp. PMI_573]|nr:isotrichodermin C-15 hydroxylase [Diaporthaceae sp. PMI_573]
MVSLLEESLPSPAGALFGVGVCFALWLGGYVIYQVYLHPLARFPGPFWASVTDLWQTYQCLTLKQPYTLMELHAKYGQFVRYGPDKLSITAEGAIPLIYQKGGRTMPKTEYYDGFGAPNPTLFGMRDEEKHSIRRRHMSHSFSISYVKDMEKYLDENVLILRNKVAGYAERGAAFNLKQLIQFYVVDVLGELAFSQSFGIQVADDESLKWLPRTPHKGLQTLFNGRAACASLASRCRKDILTNLILAKDPDTGENLTQANLETQAFGFIIAGTHTTSATTTLLFWNLLHNPDAMDRCVDEVADKLPGLSSDKIAYSVTEVEASLPFLRQCVRENFRSTPVFTMLLPRRVMAPRGIVIAGKQIPQGTSVAVCNHAFHHDPAIWGVEHNVFDPDRWEKAENAKRARYLMHFGLGGRQCIGKTVAQTNIYKLASTLLREFEFCLADAEEREAVSRGDFRGVLPPLITVGISDLEGPLMVRAKKRDAATG